ncbi:hypothetical protein LB565_27810 [Mesorhizobium sp. CA14]|uniref:cupin domain-containing protein n=1 Tax=Mesorhizobium sp. CA14 TaxID=2876642 RepID=UPI001CC902A4|nr:hypothetical protein [Mesorhizobium sp. CA14]MBZ9851795.1 hypothetical protein [Mesorhizobium sp. CA14]
MNTTVSTADVHPRDAFDYWHEELCKKVVPHDCTPEDRQTFSAKTQSAPLADIALVQYESTPMENDVTGRHVARANSDEVLIRLQTAGIFLFEQDGREGVLEAGDILLFDTRRPFRGRYLDGAKELILKVPRRQLEARIGDVRQAVARPIKRLEAEHGLTSSYLAMLPSGRWMLPLQNSSGIMHWILSRFRWRKRWIENRAYRLPALLFLSTCALRSKRG